VELLPLYDANAPIACTLSAVEKDGRLELFVRMRSAMTRVERTEYGLLLHFPPEPMLEQQLREFSIAEKSCCQFWGFAVEAAPQTLILRWDGPPSAGLVLDRLAALFAGDVPGAALKGLL
jgi:hypothetical protein